MNKLSKKIRKDVSNDYRGWGVLDYFQRKMIIQLCDLFHNFILNGINDFLGTDFDESDIETIYTYLGNRCNHEKTVRFIESNYNMSVLKGGAE